MASGVLLALSFPVFDMELLAWIGLVPLFFSLRNKTLLQSIYLGLISGLAFYLILLYWIPVPVTVYGKLPIPLGILLLFILALYLSLYTATFAFLMTFLRIRRGIVPVVLSAPAIWVSLELLVTYFLTGFPWGLLGYSQYLHLPVIQIADVTGVYGIGFVIVMVNAGIYRGFERHLEGMSFWKGRSMWAATLILVLVLSYGYWRMNPRDETHGKGLNVGVAQGNIDQDQKWDREYQNETVATYINLTHKISAGGVDLIVWPETAVPLYFQNEGAYRQEILNTARETHSYLLFGSPAYSRNPESVRYYNSAFMISPEMETIGRYDKIHLVPFGEYVPLKKLLFFVDKLAEGIGDFSSGQSFSSFNIPGANIGTLICYEGIFPDLTRKHAREGASIFVNITNDAWFGRTSAPYQHLAMYALRAVENRVPVVRAANTGISAIINKAGMITSRTTIFERSLIKGSVALSDNKTFYTRFGDLFAYLCVMLASFVIFSSFYKKR